MPTVILDPLPVEIDELLYRRKRLGLDHADEMWDGVLHVNPSRTAAGRAQLADRPRPRAVGRADRLVVVWASLAG